jgi:hypothetical protein
VLAKEKKKKHKEKKHQKTKKTTKNQQVQEWASSPSFGFWIFSPKDDSAIVTGSPQCSDLRFGASITNTFWSAVEVFSVDV